MSLDLCKEIKLPKIGDDRGDLSFCECYDQIPFEIQRVYYLSNVPSGQMRGFHAHIQMQAFMIPISGNFTLVLDDGKRRKQFQMMDRSVGVYIPSGIWRELSDFSSDAVCLVLASTRYSESDYIRDYSEFLEVQNG